MYPNEQLQLVKYVALVVSVFRNKVKMLNVLFRIKLLSLSGVRTDKIDAGAT